MLVTGSQQGMVMIKQSQLKKLKRLSLATPLIVAAYFSHAHHIDVVTELRQAIDDGNYHAAYSLANIYIFGTDGVNTDVRKGLDYLRHAAEHGSVDAQFQIATYYRNGHLIDEDHNMARYWYSLAAEQGHVNAQYQLALLYRHDDIDKAVSLLNQAARAGLTDAQQLLAGTYASGKHGLPKNDPMAYLWFSVLAKTKGHERYMQEMKGVSLNLSSEKITDLNKDAQAIVAKFSPQGQRTVSD